MDLAKPRKFSTSTPVANANSSSTASMLGAFTNELDRIAPKFEIQGSQIHILRTPSDFYETLKVRPSITQYKARSMADGR